MELPEILAPLHPFFMAVSFVFGALVGSFCNVCASRWPADESVVSPRSRCPKCRNPIAWYDNIPIISWLILGAKCRHCSQPISWQYPLVEVVTGILFVLVYMKFLFSVATPIYMLFCAAMVIVTFQDLADWTIPDQITLPGIPIGLVLALIGMAWPESGLIVTDVFDALIGVLLGGGILFALDRITVLILKKPGMGMGDVKLLAMAGAFIGWKGSLGTLMIGSLIGSIVGVSVILYYRSRRTPAAAEKLPAEPAAVDESEASTPTVVSEEAEAPAAAAKADAAKAATREEEEDDYVTLEGHYLPFGPYLALGSVIYLLVGPELLAMYQAALTL